MANNFTTLPDHVIELCTSNESVSSLLAQDPQLAPGEAWKKLYGHHATKHNSKAIDSAGKASIGQEELERAAKCGKWGPTQPSELFLRVCCPCSVCSSILVAQMLDRYTTMRCAPRQTTLQRAW
jgi:hypothetical protein